MDEPTETWVVGIDSSTQSVAMVALEVNTGAVRATKVKLQKVPERPYLAYKAARQFILRLPIGSVQCLAIEAPVIAGARNIQSTIKQAIVNGAIQAGAVSAGVHDVHEVAVSTWKSKALGHGGLDKPGVQKRVAELWPHSGSVVGTDQDLNDAWAIAQYTVLLHSGVLT